MASECSEPQSEMFIASPAMRLAQAISWRAARFSPSATTAGSARPARRMASRAIAVPTGLRECVTLEAIAWARASMPPHDVTVAGAPYVSAGSTSAYCARMNGAAIPVFVWVSSSAMTMPPETSDPDPAVVGIATSGSAGAEAARSRSAATARYGRPTLCARRAAFARSITEPPPIAIDDVGLRRGEGRADGIGLT